MSTLTDLEKRTQVNVLVAFVDLSLYTQMCLKMDDSEVASWIDRFFERLTQIIESKQGLIVKFIGDGALIVFEENLAEQGILSLLKAKNEIDAWLQSEGYPCRLEVKIHFGPAIAGPFGGKAKKSFDVIGKTINAAARLQQKPFCVSAEAFQQLSPEGRKYFKEHAPPIVYIPNEHR